MKVIRVAHPTESDAEKSGRVEIADGIVDSIVAGFSLIAKTPKAGARHDAIDLRLRLTGGCRD